MPRRVPYLGRIVSPVRGKCTALDGHTPVYDMAPELRVSRSQAYSQNSKLSVTMAAHRSSKVFYKCNDVLES